MRDPLTEIVRVHSHMDDGLRYWTDGSGYDCPPERGCWHDLPRYFIGAREIRTSEGIVVTFPVFAPERRNL